MKREIGKITETMLGYEGHGILTCYLTVDYGGAGQSIGGYGFDTPVRRDGELIGRFGVTYGMEFVARIIKACGVDSWEKVKGRTIFVLHDLPDDAPSWGASRVIGIENLPTEKGCRFIFTELRDELLALGVMTEDGTA